MACRAILDQPIQAELGRAPHDRPGEVAQPRHIAAERVVLPQVVAEPRARQREVGPLRLSAAVVAHRRRLAPEVGVVVRAPAAAAVVDAGRFRAVHAQILDEVEERGVALGQVGDLGRPVVHLRVDVDRVVRAPRRPDHVVPDALEIGRDGVRPRAGDEQIAAILEEQAHQRGILIGGVVPNTLVGGQILAAPRTQVERDAAEKRLVLGQVRGQQARPTACAGRLRARPRPTPRGPSRRRRGTDRSRCSWSPRTGTGSPHRRRTRAAGRPPL